MAPPLARDVNGNKVADYPRKSIKFEASLKLQISFPHTNMDVSQGALSNMEPLPNMETM